MAELSIIDNIVFLTGLSVFLSSCNHQDGWVGLAETRAQQYGKLADLLLSCITDFAQNEDSYSLALALKNMAEHHFMASMIRSVECEKVCVCLYDNTK